MRHKILRKLFPSYLLVTLVAVAGITAVFSTYIRKTFLAETYAHLEVYHQTIQNSFLRQPAIPLDQLCVPYAGVALLKVSILAPSGERLCDSMDRVSEGELSATLEPGRSLRFNKRLGAQELFLVSPLRNQQHENVGWIRTSQPETFMLAYTRTIFLKVLGACAVVFLFSSLVGFIFSKRLSFPLNEMKRGALRFAGGDLKQPVFVPEIEELASLSMAMNKMARDLSEKIETEIRQRTEKDIILASMAEAVLAVDPEHRVISINAFALKLFNVSVSSVIGRPIQEMIRNTALETFIHDTLSTATPDIMCEGEIVLQHDKHEKFLQAHGTLLRDADQKIRGALIVLNDVTHLRQLENIRKEFVANVSHELKTPITSIKGFVETLLDGAYQNPEDAKRFLEIVAKHADRLNLIIEDLLSLSRIEKEGDLIELERTPLKRILQSALVSCDSKLKAKHMQVTLECPDQLHAKLNASLFEQALVNLVDNAIKYSDPEKSVHVTAAQLKDQIQIAVKDEGVGISPEHLPRLFERFYRVDKSRSRNLGGTGLGLSIVKHIAQAHQGSVTVESTPGRGTTFLLNIPAA